MWFCGVCLFHARKDVFPERSKSKEKNQYHILMHIPGIEKNGIDELTFKAEIETRT